jgi:hypothetical protein
MGKSDIFTFKCVSVTAVLAFCAVNLNALGYVVMSGLLFALAAFFILLAIMNVIDDIFRGEWR